MWKRYFPLYERLEEEVCRLTFTVELCDTQLQVHGIGMAEILQRCGAEAENAAKALVKTRGLSSAPASIPRMNFPTLGSCICSQIRLDKRSVNIKWPYQTLTKPQRRPFAGWSPGRSTNPGWYDAYNKVKHDRDANLGLANFENVVDGLSAVFILSLWLRRLDIEKGGEWIEFARTRMESYSQFFSPGDCINLHGGGTNRRLILNEV